MAVIGTNFSLNEREFLDSRTNLPKTKSDLKNWKMLVPEGFEVLLSDNTRYYYDSTKNLPETGHWVLATVQELEDSTDDRRPGSVNLIKEVKRQVDEMDADMSARVDLLENKLFPPKFTTLIAGSRWLSGDIDELETEKEQTISIINSLTEDLNYDFNRNGIIDTPGDVIAANEYYDNSLSFLAVQYRSSSSTYTLDNGFSTTPDITWSVEREGKPISEIPGTTITGPTETFILEPGHWASRGVINSDSTYTLNVQLTKTLVLTGKVHYVFGYRRYTGVLPQRIEAGQTFSYSDFPSLLETWNSGYKMSQTDFNCSGGKYPTIMIPSSAWSKNYKIYVGGFYNTDFSVLDITITNRAGLEIAYKVIQSNGIQTGKLPIEIC